MLERARLTTLLLPGVGTVEELERANDLGVRIVRVATHCTEADISAQHIATAREIGMDVSGFLMMCHMAPPADLAGQAKLMESYGAHCVYVTDSGGRLTMDDVAERVRAYRDVSTPPPRSGSTRTRTSRSRLRTRLSPCRTASSASTLRWPDTVPAPATAPIEAFIAVANSSGWSTAATYSGSRTPPTTSSVPCRIARSGRPGDAHAGLCGRLLQLPAPRRGGRRALRNGRARPAPGGGRRRLVGGQEDMIVDIALDRVAARDGWARGWRPGCDGR